VTNLNAWAKSWNKRRRVLAKVLKKPITIQLAAFRLGYLSRILALLIMLLSRRRNRITFQPHILISIIDELREAANILELKMERHDRNKLESTLEEIEHWFSNWVQRSERSIVPSKASFSRIRTKAVCSRLRSYARTALPQASELQRLNTLG